MGRQALLAVINWLTLSAAFGVNTALQAAVDNESAESAPRLYRSAPLGGYASAAPYGAYSFHLPTYVAGPFTSASQPVPVKQEALVISNNNAYLKDSYGNRFVASPQTLGYKMAFPQQYLPIQKLPEHLAQPLVGASANFQFKETAPQVFVGSPYRIPALQSPSSTPNGKFTGFSQQLVYADKAPNAQQQSSNNKAVFINSQANGYFGNEPKYHRIQEIYGQPKFQRIQQVSQPPYGEAKYQRIQEPPRFPEYKYERYGEPKQQEQKAADSATLQAVPVQKTVTYVNDVDGKTTVVKLETQPPVPLLDLTLLEPITFENPLVPQVQHFLPRIHQATYQKLPQELFKTIKQKKPSEPPKKVHHKITPKISTVSHHETLDEAPEIAYEINQPNYKETYSEKAVKYNTETTSPPVTITYGSKTENEPVTYSYSRSSEDPPQNQEIRYDDDVPSPLVYQLTPEEQNKEIEDVENHSSEDESESLRESPRQSDRNNHYHELAEEYKDRPQSNNYYDPRNDGYYQQNSAESNDRPKSEHIEQRHDGSDHQPLNENKESTKSYQHHERQHDDRHPKEYNDSSKPNEHREQRNEAPYNQQVEEYKENSQSQQNQEPRQNPHYHQESPHLELQHEGPYRQAADNYKDSPKPNHHEPRHDDQKKYHKSNHESHSDVKQHPQKSYPHPTQISAQNYEELEPITREYEEDIRLLPTPSAIRVDPNQHVQYTKSTSQPHSSHRGSHSSSDGHPHEPHTYNDYSSPTSQRQESPGHQHYSSPQSEPHIHEKSKRIIIKEETPESMHMLTEKMRKETIQREENSEEDFEKAYKDAAVGFPAYSHVAKESEKSIFDPASYGVPPEHIEYDIEQVPFQQYQEEGDGFPKAVRSSYKDARDQTKDDYYAGYKLSTPERLNDRYRNKNDYYTTYRNNKPDYLDRDEGSDKNKKQEKSAKYTAAPSHEYPPQKAKSYYAPYKPKQQLYEYDYSRGPPRDNSAFASIPLHRYRLKTNFVEPQFQYGFEPVSIPKLLDSELAAMASNLSPESEKPGMRKKIYKENWYIKQTSMSGGDPTS